MAQLGARLDGIEEVVGSNPIGSTTFIACPFLCTSYRASPCRLRGQVTNSITCLFLVILLGARIGV